jgi:hypothetical protein
MNIINIKMNTKELNRLLEKYYKGESTEAEEEKLRRFFSGENIPEGYDTEKAIFCYYDEANAIPEPSYDFEARILDGIDRYEEGRRKFSIRRHLIPSLSAAAGILLLAGSYFFFIHRSEPRDTFTDPQIAYAETMKILMNVSSQLNRGAMALEPVGKMNEMTTKSLESIHKSTKIVERNLKSLDYLERAIEIINVPAEKSLNK